jgi:lysophospholipid acyltransferase (LPLAT)-like uncharacterized protein
MGHGVIRGSSTSGGAEALRELTRLLARGYGAILTPDGPKGPPRVAKLGCVIAARGSGAPLVPLGCAISPCAHLKSWDRTAVALPFARMVLGYGDPIAVPRDAERDECEAVRARLDAEMAVLEERCRAALRGP